MGQIKDKVLEQAVENAEETNLKMVDMLVAEAVEIEDYTSMSLTFEIYFLKIIYKIGDELLDEVMNKFNLFQTVELVNEIAKATGLYEMVKFYREELKYRYKVKNMNAIQVLKSVVDQSEEVISNLESEVEKLIQSVK